MCFSIFYRVKDPTTDKPHTNPTGGPGKTPADSVPKSLVKGGRFTSLHKLVSVGAWSSRLLRSCWRLRRKAENKEKANQQCWQQENGKMRSDISPLKGKTFPLTALNRLVVYKDEDSEL